MTDPFRQFFLDTIENILEEDPNDESLLRLLRTAVPSLSLDQSSGTSTSTSTSTLTSIIDDKERRTKALRTLKSRIHPDKHPNDKRATFLFQNVQIFYDECIANLGSKKRSDHRGRKRRQRSCSDNDASSSLSQPGQQFPLEFDATLNWPHINLAYPRIPMPTVDGKLGSASSATPRRRIDGETLPCVQAYKCLNGRGALAHGRPISHHFVWKDVLERTALKSVEDVFHSIGKGIKELRSVEDIKEEIMEAGPVVSVSFRLCDAYLQRIRNGRALEDGGRVDGKDGALCAGFVRECVGRQHELLIVGWGITTFGEVWKVLPLWESDNPDTIDTATKNGNNLHEEIPPLTLIGMGQFGIDKLCLAPKTNLDHLPWQRGPYFDSDFSDAPKWRTWKEMDLPLTAGEFQKLANCFEKGLVHAANSCLQFVIRDQKRLAHSASYRLKEFRWEESTLEWITTVVLVTETNEGASQL